MSGRGNKKLSRKNDENRRWHIGVYGRRSFDDGENSESYTIKNQKALIESFLENKANIEIEDYYIDDGYTGTNFERPDFKRMLQDVVNGKINSIIVKDLSRLGRNHREVGKYIEEVFPVYDIRIISVNDNVDSYLDPDSISSLIVPVKNLMNENYSRDISKKVASAYKVMAKNGEFVAGTTPYGYMLDSENKHHLVIDPDEVDIVKKIFDMALSGSGRPTICKYLNDSGILCRKEIQRRKKRKLTLDPFEIKSNYLWSTSTIGRMLHNESYIGNLVQLKTTRATFGSKKIISKDEDEYIRSQNTHEAIISKEDFNKVQKLIKQNDKNKKHKAPTNYSIFNGILKCSDCGRAMTKQEDLRGKTQISNYFCMTYLQVSKSCSPHKIKTSDLENAVLESIQLQVKLVIELEKSLSKLYFKNNQGSIENEYKNKVKIAELKISNLKEDKRKYYEEWKFNKIEKREFIKLSEEIENKITKLNEDIELYTFTYKENIKKIRKNDYWIGHYKRNRKIKRLTKEVLNELIDVIFVRKDGTLDIKFKYQDEYQSLVNYLEEEAKENEKVDIRNISQAFVR
ncbi:recombinase family protein [Coprobacillus cateniformis]|uniref:recombinase family protein n=1 Tax=Coprobacillus cateniformis TaxID=100884 RepID=UPI003562582B